MASSTTTQHSVCFFCTQGYPCDFRNFNEWQHATTLGEESSQSSNRILPLDNASWIQPSQSSRKRKATTAIPDTGSAAGYTRDEQSFDLSLDSSIGWNDDWSRRKRSATWNDHQAGNNRSFDWRVEQNAIQSYSPPFTSSPLHEFSGTEQTEVPGLQVADEVRVGNQISSSSVENCSLLSHEVARPLPLTTDGSLVDQAQPLDTTWLSSSSMMSVSATGMQDLTYELVPHESTSSFYASIPSRTGISLGGSTYEEMGAFALDYNSFDLESHVAITSEAFAAHSHPNNSPSTIIQPKVSEYRVLLPLLPSHDATAPNISDVIAQSCLDRQPKRRSLTLEQKQATAILRKIGSCERCRKRKTKCTPGLVCDPCRSRYADELIYEIPCHREYFDQHVRAFFPTFVTAHFEKGTIQDNLRNIQVGNTTKQVRMSLAPSYPQFSVDICPFSTEEKNLSHVADLASTANDRLMSFTSIPTLEYVVPEAAVGSFKRGCRQYVDDINNFFDKTLGNSDITQAVFNAARRLHGANISGNEDILVRDILRIITAYHLLGRRLYFVEDPRLNTSEASHHQPADPTQQYRYTSKLVNIQFKAAMYELIKELLPQTLLELEGRLRTQKKEMLASCLCAILLISTCIEELQIVADAFVPTRLSNNEGEPVSIRRHGRVVCNVLEQWLLTHLELLVNSILGNVAEKRSGMITSVAMDTGARTSESIEYGGVEATLAGDLLHICDRHDKELRERAGDDRFGGLSVDVGQNKDFRMSNQARLTSKVLLGWKSCMYAAETPSDDTSSLHVPPEK